MSTTAGLMAADLTAAHMPDWLRVAIVDHRRPLTDALPWSALFRIAVDYSGLDPAAREVLRVLSDCPPTITIGATTIAERVGVSPGWVRRIIPTLARAGWLIVRTAPGRPSSISLLCPGDNPVAEPQGSRAERATGRALSARPRALSARPPRAERATKDQEDQGSNKDHVSTSEHATGARGGQLRQAHETETRRVLREEAEAEHDRAMARLAAIWDSPL